MPYLQMSALVLRWAFREPATSRYPFAPRRVLAGSRGQLEFTRDTCVFCNVCAKKCPTDALTVSRPKKLWAIDRLRCIACGACVEACPKKSLLLAGAHAGPVVTKDREWY